jgi:hypothetical protein
MKTAALMWRIASHKFAALGSEPVTGSNAAMTYVGGSPPMTKP